MAYRTASIEEKIAEIVRRIVLAVHPERIILFGSQARGQGNAQSDVDLLIVMREIGSRRRKVVELYRLLAGTGISKDIVILTPEELERYQGIVGTIAQAAVREGKVVYEQAA
ncbi:MAG: nucleotidyltransferase domain-containing protein [Deltaproteobacteria bacterium]|nr:nucleotidyltransferase domain-containing protein [Deltaproteobacteria bacterium]